MFLEAAILGGGSAAGFGLTYTRLPTAFKEFCLKHPLLTDVLATCLTYEILGGTLTALMAAGFVSVLVSVLLYVLNYRDKRRKRAEAAA